MFLQCSRHVWLLQPFLPSSAGSPFAPVPEFTASGHSLTLRSSRSRNHVLAVRWAFPVPSDAHGSHQTPGQRKRLVLFASRTPRKDSGVRGFPLRVSAQPGAPSRPRAGRRPQPARQPGGHLADSPLALRPRRRPRPRRLASPRSSRREPPPRRGCGRASPLRALLTQLSRHTNDTLPTPQSGDKPVMLSSALG